MLDKILEIKEIFKIFEIDSNKKLVACNNVNLDIYSKKILGIVGESGCGKSTLIRMITQLETPTMGEIIYKDMSLAKFSKQETRLNRKDIQMVFQDSQGAFNPKMQIKDIIVEPLLNFKLLKKVDIEKKAKELLELVGLDEGYLNCYPHNISGGQLQRVGIARALSLNPKILICDEATSALDVSTQNSIVKLLKKVKEEKGISIIFVCHDLALVKSFADEIAVMYLGNIVEILPGNKIRELAKHPYTKSLLNSVFSIESALKNTKIEILKGDIPSPLNRPEGCPFSTRCKNKKEFCNDIEPKLKKINDYHKIACHLYM